MHIRIADPMVQVVSAVTNAIVSRFVDLGYEVAVGPEGGKTNIVRVEHSEFRAVIFDVIVEGEAPDHRRGDFKVAISYAHDILPKVYGCPNMILLADLRREDTYAHVVVHDEMIERMLDKMAKAARVFFEGKDNDDD